ncbi:MAG: N-acetylglucosamine 6-phosphate deacetylase, partial [Ilumatobacteraceae bacterium]|nr:N-acetylglucosamine 6-phosphate deacetylase [Ilumatobacteraceae bacterium]
MLTEQGWSGPAEIVASADGIIVEIRPTRSPTPDVSLVPGFVDVQVNGIHDVDVASAAGADWRRLGDLLLDQGVTAWCPTLVTDRLDRFALPLERIAAALTDAQTSGDLPTIIGAHLEGPFIGGAPGAHPRELIVPIDLDWLSALPSVVRLVTLAAEIPDAARATELLSARGVVVSIGHSTPSVDDVEDLAAAGARMVTHLYNGMSGVHHREAGLAAMALVDDRLTVGLIADLVHVHRLAIQLAFRAKPANRIVLVTDAVAWRAGERRGAAGGTVGGVVMAMRDGAPRLADGTLAGSAVTMDQAVRNVVDVCGVPLDRAARAASTNPAALMGRADLGRLAVGCRADIVAL